MAPSGIFNIIVSIVRTDLDDEIVHVTEQYREAVRMHDSEPCPAIASIAKRGHAFDQVKQLHNQIRFRIEEEITKCVNLEIIPPNSIDREEVFWAVMDGQGKFDWENAYPDSDDESIDVITKDTEAEAHSPQTQPRHSEPGANSPEIKLEEPDEIDWPAHVQPPNDNSTAGPSQPQQPSGTLTFINTTTHESPRAHLRYPRGVIHDGWLHCPYPGCSYKQRGVISSAHPLRHHIRVKHFKIRYCCGVAGCQAMFTENNARNQHERRHGPDAPKSGPREGVIRLP